MKLKKSFFFHPSAQFSVRKLKVVLQGAQLPHRSACRESSPGITQISVEVIRRMRDAANPASHRPQRGRHLQCQRVHVYRETQLPFSQPPPILPSCPSSITGNWTQFPRDCCTAVNKSPWENLLPKFSLIPFHYRKARFESRRITTWCTQALRIEYAISK